MSPRWIIFGLFCAYGCSIHCNQKLKDIELKVLFKGKNIYIINEKSGERTAGSGEMDHGTESSGSRYQKTFVFEDPVCLSDIEDVELVYK